MRPRQLASRFVLLACYGGLFLLVWPWLGDAYAAAFRAGGASVCMSMRVRPWSVQLRPLDATGAMLDTELVLTHAKTKRRGSQPISSRYIGYAPTTLLLALILASPVVWKRRIWAMVWGLLLIHVWIALSLFLLVIHGFNRSDTLGLFSFSPFVSTMLSYAVEVVVVATVTKYAVPAVVWMLVTFRREDWQRLVERGARLEAPAS